MSAQEEAAQIFASVVDALTGQSPDLKAALRQCLHACQILGWNESARWFEQELGGYALEAELPPHRIVKARLVWQSVDFPQLTTNSLFANNRVAKEITRLPVEIVDQEVRAPIEWIIAASQTGYAERTGETRRILIGDQNGINLALERIKYLDTPTILSTRVTVEHFTFEFASKSYAQLAYGQTLTDVWQRYRQRVDEALVGMSLGDHLSAIQTGIQSANPQDHRNAVFGCRNLLEDVARFLWRDSRETYSLLQGDGPGNKLRVSEDKYANRLAAYLHQKGISGERGKFYRDELERLAVSIRSLAGLQSQAHQTIALPDAQSTALATYFVIGTLATLTDLVPITEYSDPLELPSPE